MGPPGTSTRDRRVTAGIFGDRWDRWGGVGQGTSAGIDRFSSALRRGVGGVCGHLVTVSTTSGSGGEGGAGGGGGDRGPGETGESGARRVPLLNWAERNKDSKLAQKGGCIDFIPLQ